MTLSGTQLAKSLPRDTHCCLYYTLSHSILITTSPDHTPLEPSSTISVLSHDNAALKKYSKAVH